MSASAATSGSNIFESDADALSTGMEGNGFRDRLWRLPSPDTRGSYLCLVVR